MTLISVGSTGTPGPQGARGSAGSDGAAPSGFEELLAGAHPAHEAHPDPARDAANDSSREKSSGEQPCDVAAHAPASTADNAGATGTADSADGSTSGDTPKKPDGSDPGGVLAALAVPVPATPTATIPPTAADATGTGTAAATDATATVVDPSVIADATVTTTPSVDLAQVLAALPTEDAPPTVEPVLLPLPDLTATSARTGADTTHASAATRESSTPPAAATAEHARPTPASLPQTTGAATFAAPPPPPVASAAMANVNTDAETAAAARTLPPPSEQLVSVLTPLRMTQNGTYTLRLELKPPELGRVEMRVEMRDGVLHASIHAEQHNAAQVLRDALSDLRERLGSEGVHTGELTVSDGSVGSRQSGSGRTPESRGAQLDLPTNDSREPTDTPNLSPTLDPEATSLLDVRV
jgi:flagellar hook-length control protein FliK